MKKVLVTGGAGFIGSHLVDSLVKNRYEVVYLDNLSTLEKGERAYCSEHAEFVYGDVANYDFLDKIIKKHKIKIIFHIAANADVPYSAAFPMVDFQSNALGIFNLLNIAIRRNIDKFIFASTAAVYGEPQYTPMDEKHPLCPVSNYGVTKLYGEKLCIAYHKTYGLDSSVIRIFNTYGPRQSKYVLYDLIKKLSYNKEKLEVLGDGTQIRDYSYIDNTVLAFMKVLESPKSKGQVYNIAGGSPVSIKDLVGKLVNVLNINPCITYTGQSWKGDINNLTADISKIKNDLAYKPTIPFDEGLGLTIDWFKKHKFKI